MRAKQVIVMRTDLNMRKGKMIAQGAHAAMAWLASDAPGRAPYSPTQAQRAWLDDGLATKICVQVDSEATLLAVHDAALRAGLESHLITDAGLTEFGGVRTVTCCAIGPDYSERIDAITGKLKLL